jgi:hypothetical protein
VNADATKAPGAVASPAVLPISWPGSFLGSGLAPGSAVFVGQYLFSGAETTSAYLTVKQVWGQARLGCVGTWSDSASYLQRREVPRGLWLADDWMVYAIAENTVCDG